MIQYSQLNFAYNKQFFEENLFQSKKKRQSLLCGLMMYCI